MFIVPFHNFRIINPRTLSKSAKTFADFTADFALIFLNPILSKHQDNTRQLPSVRYGRRAS